MKKALINYYSDSPTGTFNATVIKFLRKQICSQNKANQFDGHKRTYRKLGIKKCWKV